MAKFTPGQEFTCEWCGKLFVLGYHRDEKPTYCSTECSGKAQSDRVELECESCGVGFTKSRWKYENRDHHYCSRECWNDGQRNRVEVSCEVCGTTETVTETRANYYRTCSRECLNAVQSDEFSGADNPNYNEDVSDEKIRSLYEQMTTRGIADELGVSTFLVADRLRKMGVELDDSPWAAKTYETDRGEMVRSSYEKRVADYLYDKDIDYQYEPSFPGPYTPDFLLENGAIIEVWGVVSDEYHARKQKKQEWYADREFTVIGIEPTDCERLPAKIGE